MRMLLGVIVVAACGGTQKPNGDGTGTGSATPPQPVAQTLLAFAATGGGSSPSKIFLEVTDHNGSMQSYPIGEADPPCERTPGNGDDIITVMKCDASGTGVELRAVYRRGTEIIVLRRSYTPEDDPADVELSFREVTRIPVPAGAAVKPAS
jgi:hypothetical protein